MSEIPPTYDRRRAPLPDPTANVRAIVDAATQRQDDLRALESKTLRMLSDLRAVHHRELRDKEGSRIDAILANVSDTAVTTAAAAETRATTLASQVATSADAMRAQVAAAAQASNDTLDRRFDPIQKSIDEIRRFQFETQGGKLQTVETHTKQSGWGLWAGIGIAAFVGFNSLILTVAGIVVTIVLTR